MAKHPRLPYLLIPLATLIVIHPLFAHGCSCGHDLDFHLISWQDAAAQFAHGNFHPRWAATPAYGAGEPRFVFYPPLSWTLGALLTLFFAHLVLLAHHLPGLHGLSPGAASAATPIAFTWIALTAAGLAMLRLARRFVPTAAATFAGILYLANPYTLFTAYERAAFAELLAAAWLPLLLAALLPSPGRNPPRPLSILGVALPLALLWLTNAPAAVIGSYLVLLLISLRLLPLLRSSPRAALSLAVRAISATALALALAAFYIVPAVHEQPWVEIRMAILPGLRPADNTLFHHTADALHDQVLHTASDLALLLLLVSAIALLFPLLLDRLLPERRKPRRVLDPLAGPLVSGPGYVRVAETPPPALLSISPPAGAIEPRRTLLVLTAAIALLLTPISLPLWRYLPELAFLQFPWRLLALLAPVAALALALLAPRLRLRPRPLSLLALLLAALLAVPAYRAFHQHCDPEDTPQASFALVHALTHGTNIHNLDDEPADDPTDEYTPVTADNGALAQTNPPFRLLPQTAPDDTPPPAGAIPGPAPRSLDLVLPKPGKMVLNLRRYPLFLVRNNGEIVTDRIDRDDGLLAFPLPAGAIHLTITTVTPPVERAANAVSLAALALTAVLAINRRRSSHPS